ncbi:MAG TPA: hypothetical protein VKI61_16005, partial [Chitinophagaceae bacterium]|nr:hypothetical protein [Chitinophagaceae bacterium]
VHFTARADKEMNQRNNPLAIYLKATDENDMAIMDGRVQLIVTPDVYGSNNYFGEKVFLPDTLWNHTQPLEALGETKIIIPDSIFPAASFDYQVQCMFLNEDNEYKTVTLSESFQNNKHKIFFTESKDSLKIEQKTGQDGEMAAGFLYCFGEKNDTLQTQTLQLPATIHINPFVKYYVIETDSAEATFQLKHSRDMVSCLAARTKDSINIQGINPKHISFWYTIFAGNKVIHRGFGDSLSYMEKTHTAKNYFVSLQYVYGNEVYNEEYTVPYQDKLLNVQVNQPEFIYPGQKIAVDISVTNKAGKPVNNADITAYSFTDKFEDGRAPFVPYMGKIYPRTKGYMNFYKAALDNKIGSSNLNWQRWSREMGLDSIEYFKFLHPENIYTNTETATDSVTQLAPFVVIKGDLQPIHQIYID